VQKWLRIEGYHSDIRWYDDKIIMKNPGTSIVGNTIKWDGPPRKGKWIINKP